MLLELFTKWKYETSNLARVQWVYGAVFIGLLFLSGLLSLIDGRYGNRLASASVYFAVFVAINFVTNAIIVSVFGQQKPRSTRRPTNRS